MDRNENQLVEATTLGFESAVEELNSNPTFMALLVSFPLMGPILREFIGAKSSKIVQRRITELLSNVENKIAAIGERNRDESFFATEEFHDLLFRAMKFSSETRQKEKINLFASIVGNSCQKGARVGHDPEWYLQILNEVTLHEWRVAVGLFEIQAPHANEFEDAYCWGKSYSWRDLNHILDLRKDEVRLILNRLHKFGLVVELSEIAAIMDEGRSFLISPLLCKIIAYLKNEQQLTIKPLERSENW